MEMTKQVKEWQVECNDIKSRLISMYRSQSWTDCVFLFGPDKLVPAHKNVLSAASSVFAAMFFGGLPETGGPIRVEDIQPDIFSSMLRYIYTDVVDIGSFEDACALYYAAHKYTLLHLQTECLNYLNANLSAEHCCLAYEFAQLFSEESLLKSCEMIMRTKTMEVLVSSGFLATSLNTVKFIYSMDNLAINSELDLFEALERYNAEHTVKRDKPSQNAAIGSNQIAESNKKISNDNIEEGELEEKKEENPSSATEDKVTVDETIEDSKPEKITIFHILKLIRFLTMRGEEFARVPAVSSLLTQSEITSLIININHPRTNVPMPEGFSTLQKLRFQDESRILVNFRSFINCDHLKKGTSVKFSSVSGLSLGFQAEIILLLNDKNVYVVLLEDKKNSKIEFILKIRLVSNECVDYYEYRSNPYQLYNCAFHYLGQLGNWDDLKSKYLEDGKIIVAMELEALKPETK